MTIQVQNVVTPAVTSAFYQTNPSTNTSDKYKLVSTEQVTQFFQEKGFFISNYQEAGTIKEEYKGKSKHLVRLRPDPVQYPELYLSGDVPEIIIFNSHNKYTSLKINIGIYRFICLNGMILGDEFFSERIIHSGNNVEIQLEALLVEALFKFKEVSSTVERLKGIEATTDLKDSLALFAMTLRRTSSTTQFLTAWDVNANLTPTREGDKGNDLYTIMNILQEKLLRGGFRYTHEDKDKNTTSKYFKETTSLSNIEKINKQLFDYTLKLVA